MDPDRINRASSIGIAVLSLIAFGTVLIGLVLPALKLGHVPPPEPDEGTAAHVFQLSVAALLPVGCVFLATADWVHPLRAARRLVVPGVAVVLAFSILYYFEKYYPAHH